MNKYLLTLITIICTVTLWAQDTLTSDNCSNNKINYSMQKQYGRYMRTYEMGGQRITNDQLAERLNLFPESANEYRLAKKSQRAALISLAIGFPLLIVGDIYGQQQKVSNGVLIGGSISMAYVIQIPGFLYIKHRRRSLSIYNRKICGR